MRLLIISFVLLNVVFYGIYTLKKMSVSEESDIWTAFGVTDSEAMIGIESPDHSTTTPTPKADAPNDFDDTPEPPSENDLQSIANALNIETDLLHWYFSMPPTASDQTEFFGNSTDKMYLAFYEKMLENPAAFIRLATAGFDNPYLQLVLEELPSQHVDLLLPYINQHANIAEIAYQRNLHISHPALFEEALFKWSGAEDLVPVSLLLPAIKNNTKGAYALIEYAAVNGIGRTLILTELENSDQIDESVLAERMWQNYADELSPDRQAESAYIAARYLGDRDAIKELARLYARSRDIEKQILEHYMASLAQNFDLRKIGQYTDLIEYDPIQKKWYLPS